MKDPAASVRYQALLQLLRTAETIWNGSRAFFERWNLSTSQFNVLNLLSSCPDGLTQIELSRQLIMHRSNVTGLVDRLEAKGLVRRNARAEDRRAYSVVLTQEGRALLEQILPHYYEVAEEVWKGFNVNQVKELTQGLATLAAQTEKLTKQIEEEKNESFPPRRPKR